MTKKAMMTTISKKIGAAAFFGLAVGFCSPVQAQQAQTQQAPFRQQQFVPDISVIVDVGAGGYSLADQDRQPSDTHHQINPNSGFNLNYAELTLSAPIDPFVELFSTFHLSAFEFEIEEAYARTRGLPWNTEVIAGKFLSHFGRINGQHAHFWSFNDKPLVYDSFFGSENLNELGVRLGWLVPTDFFLDLGLEVLQGVNPNSFGQRGFVSGAQELKPVDLPNLIVATAKTSFDLTPELTMLAGLSYARGGTRIVEADADEDAHAGHFHAQQLTSLTNYVASTQVLGADLSLRWFFNSYTDLTWQSEILMRQSEGSQYTEGVATAVSDTQVGGYSQVLWRFAQQWRTGLRADLLTQSQGPQSRYTAMMDYLPSEFTRLRLQYNLNATGFSSATIDKLPAVHGVFLNLNLVMGAHGAHEF